MTDTVHTIAGLRNSVSGWKRAGLKVGMVPTMGALHAGHLALVAHAKTLCDKVLVSIFVNPRQFAPTEDLGRYPRQEARDIEALGSVGCDLVYLPTPEVMYPPGFSSAVHIGGPSQGLETDFRPQFFDGVTTVVTKLFNQATPDIAVFGEKDYQQLKVITAMVRDLDLAVQIIGHPTAREDDGLALSSRNAYLSPTERAAAPALYAQLIAIRDGVREGADADSAIATAKAALLKAGFGKIDYIALRHAEDLSENPPPDAPRRLLAALWLGQTRLIDNIAV